MLRAQPRGFPLPGGPIKLFRQSRALYGSHLAQRGILLRARLFIRQHESKLPLSANEPACQRKRLVELRNFLSTATRVFGPATAFATHQWSDLLDDFAGLELLRQFR